MQSAASTTNRPVPRSPGLGATSGDAKPTFVIEPRRGLLNLGLKAVWAYRELLYFIVWRDVKIRYKQTVIGVAWVIIQPVLTMILADFMVAHRMDKCVYLDSDVLLYANVSTDIEKFRRFDFTLCWHTVGCVLFVNRLGGLQDLCRFMMDVYTKREHYHYDRMVAHFATRQRHRLPGGTCDMTALQLYNDEHFGRVGEASHIIDGSVYDPNINAPHPGFEMENDIKKIVWENGQPYGTYLPTGEKVRFNSLHFNGRAKSLMERFCTTHGASHNG